MPQPAAKSETDKIIFLASLLVICVFGFSAGLTKSSRNSEPAAPRERGDTDYLFSAGDVLKATGIITTFDVSGWNRTFDLTIGSLLPGEARDLATTICYGDNDLASNVKGSWEVRVFLPVGERPAAVCNL